MTVQKPVKSGFNASSTASDVLRGLDLTGKTAFITGGHSGLGLEATKALSTAGVHVVVGARDVESAARNLSELDNITIFPMDLSDIASISSVAALVSANRYQFDYVLCNAGIMACPERRVGSGWESQFATNHIGHYVLVNLIWNNIRSGGRVVCVSSAGHHNSPIRWDDIQFSTGYDKWLAYGQSKTANVLFALQLDNYGKDRDIRAFSLHPGKIFTPLQRHLTNEEMAGEGWIDKEGNPIDPTFKSTAQGAATEVWAATNPKLNGLGGLYCEDCDVTALASEYSEPFMGVCEYAVDPAEALKLWKFTANLTGINAFSDR
ncbi:MULTISPECIES: SDR family NAD(P)-dependent oxidoreductase [Serratia]|uniref:SDR family NAD(P)-dependent oxidoreductase n=1 Tax=Serratia TaxID=613 RepID=UPI0003AEC4EF|nr:MULTISPECIES: SDR family NAD(P)-dependent oxidoreductase [Serratia]ERK05734.1 Dehydrogenase [Serratia fonticola AU-AP2C]MBP1000086.1 SDR family NAD(P)-dependent oxidoreductase [Serratia fonticola]MBP1005056.1 SDR family NAD(P)-dependent oxidoreductase [Serratia fonticola]MBP1014831.1 SDR family NAD(P)-dependent oxidoreductase [Serratia fonticola]MBP1016804.1 SDR family NAD(P)-dependent oxidoreductase [Serratia fonticola]